MKFYIIDCFAEEKYSGNELLVIIADRFISDEEQQKIAREINFSETAFILSKEKQSGGYDVRIWTPNVGEVPFAGHPTLGTAYVIHNFLESRQNSRIILNLKVGQITVNVSENIYTMEQNPPIFGVKIDSKIISDIFGISPYEISDNFPIQWVSTGLEAVIVPLKNKEALKKVKVDEEKFKDYIQQNLECNCNHLFFTDAGNDSFYARCIMEDFIEDPATGSANGCLAAYLLKHGYFKKNDVSYTVYQGEEMGRPSVLNIKATFNGENISVKVGGKCQTVAYGDWA